MNVFRQNLERFGKELKAGESPTARYLYVHFAELNGHYYQDSGHAKIMQLCDRIIMCGCKSCENIFCDEKELVD